MYISQDHSIWTIHTPAKLNLFFEVLGKRPDGYHEISSLVLPIRLFDTLQFEPTEGSSIDFDCGGGGNDVPRDEKNIVVRALRFLQQHSGIERGARLRLFKRIPSQAGLGGGSSDAAAALAVACRAWGLDYGTKELSDLSAGIGSDCPIFFRQGASLVAGRGERIESFGPIPSLYFVLVKPAEGLSTAAVYAQCMSRHDGRFRSVDGLSDSLRRGDIATAGRRFFNRLETVAHALWSRFAEIRRILEKLDCPAVRMTGSGTAFYGLCRSAKHAGTVAGILRQRVRKEDRVYCVRGV